MPIWTSEQARRVDSLSSEVHKIPSHDLMEEAGRCVYEMCLCIWRPYQRILVLAGPGNNGGDALVAARLLHLAGFAPEVWSILPEHSQETNLRQRQRAACLKVGIKLVAFKQASDFAHFGPATLIIDGVLGLGLRTCLRQGLTYQALQAAGAIRAQTVLAIDLPSGLSADDWSTRILPLPATHTLSFGGAKLIHALAPARTLCGKVSVRDLNFHPEAIASATSEGPQLQWRPHLWQTLKPWKNLASDAHKYTRGHGLVIGGSPGKIGAAYLAAEASLRSGAGWISVAALADHAGPARPSILTYEDLAASGDVDVARLEIFLQQRRVRGLLIGPGTMDSPLSPRLLELLARLNRDQGLFLVFDAGALQTWVARCRGLRFDPHKTLLTPHPGEWRAMDPTHQDLDALTKLESAWQLSEDYGVSLFYKSATPFSLWASEGRRHMHLCTDGDVRLARAGTGDLLAGISLALGLAGVPAGVAGNLAQSLLARAAKLASKQIGYHGLCGTDLLAHIASGLDPKPRDRS